MWLVHVAFNFKRKSPIIISNDLKEYCPIKFYTSEAVWQNLVERSASSCTEETVIYDVQQNEKHLVP